MLENEVIEVSHSQYSSPVVIVGKKDSKPRFYVHYRRLNQISKDVASPMPAIQEALKNISSTSFQHPRLESGLLADSDGS